MATRLDSLCDDDVHASRRRSSCVHDRPDLMENLHPYGVGTLHIRRRITPEQREHGNALLQTHRHVVLDREVQKQIHTERLTGERPNPMDFLAEERWRREL